MKFLTKVYYGVVIIVGVIMWIVILPQVVISDLVFLLLAVLLVMFGVLGIVMVVKRGNQRDTRIGYALILVTLLLSVVCFVAYLIVDCNSGQVNC